MTRRFYPGDQVILNFDADLTKNSAYDNPQANMLGKLEFGKVYTISTIRNLNDKSSKPVVRFKGAEWYHPEDVFLKVEVLTNDNKKVGAKVISGPDFDKRYITRKGAKFGIITSVEGITNKTNWAIVNWPDIYYSNAYRTGKDGLYDLYLVEDFKQVEQKTSMKKISIDCVNAQEYASLDKYYKSKGWTHKNHQTNILSKSFGPGSNSITFGDDWYWNKANDTSYEHISFRVFAALNGIELAKENKTLTLNSQYTAEVNYTDKTVKVGCQTFPFSKLEELAKLVKQD